ncbi:c-type cytochrome [Hydrogenovibrio sp. JE_KL2]|uniref:c-type cytochrome n=1 Tax=Hydrogenovibrio sp. JE_KL2 TaxID=2651188 RepID=UPI00128DAB11|nr:c-type cytochrome [Hydrogenovibrio sp. JE_KL2]MPQ75438.1 c-type cytochrome [Hydrogenovibrio sp. JE_KL2]
MKKLLLISAMTGLTCLLQAPASFALTGGLTLEQEAKVRSEYPMPSGAMLGDNCSACHGTKGAEFNEAMPPLAGMDKQKFIKQMKIYRANKFPSIVMYDVARVFSDEEIEAMADFFAKQKPEEWTLPNWNASIKGNAKENSHE